MKKRDVTTGSIKKHMYRFALPSIGGMFAITVFNLTDTYFVSKLGTNSLAAMGFTFPIVMVIGAFSSGISLGAGSLLARAMGSGNEHKMHRIATDGILLSILAVIIISTLGFIFLDPLFKLLGASGKPLELVKQYMMVWYAGAFVIIVPPVSDSCMRSMGDMIRPSLVMLVCAVFNVILDPIFIFGYFGVPEMGIKGAALATVLSRFCGMILTLSFVHFHYHLIDFKYNDKNELFESWYNILVIGLPNAMVRILPQVIRGAMTRIAATLSLGTMAVAAIAAGQRIESFATIISMAVGAAIVPIVGQNYGAQKYDRVFETRKLVIKIAIGYGLLLFIIVFPLGAKIAQLFPNDTEVIKLTARYLQILLLGSIGLNQYNWISECFNAVGKPKYAVNINILGTFLVMLPSLLIGSYIYGYVGMLIGLAIGQIIVGIYAVLLSKVYLVPLSRENT